jgi:uracil-DNA glycosylase family 4
MPSPPPRLRVLTEDVVACRRCPRLVRWREQVARVKVRRHADATYWARPVPGFGDPGARVLLVGLAPGAHGSNRTGRMFTGDASGKFLYPALYRAGFASQAEATHLRDGLHLHDLWITAVVRCAPPGNRPTPAELHRCHGFFLREWEALPRVRVVLCLGRVAHDGVARALVERGAVARRTDLPFAHGARHEAGARVVLDSYHVSQQNTLTGRLTEAMFLEVLRRAREEAGLPTRC